MKHNLLLLTDSYKHNHWKMLPQDTTRLVAYMTPRINSEYDVIKFFGLQYFIKEYLEGAVFTRRDIKDASKVLNAHFGRDYFNYEGWMDMYEKYDGSLPIKISAIKEGTVINKCNPIIKIESTDYRFAWLVTFVETLLLQVWYPTTVATRSMHTKAAINHFVNKNGSGNSDFHLHDFGVRGATCPEAAALGGAAALLNSLGTDNLPALDLIMQYYNEDTAVGYSVAASEHSETIITGPDNELETYRRFLNDYPEGIISVVLDSYDYKKALGYVCNELKEQILTRDGKFVCRPDSGDPIVMSVYTIKTLWEAYGGAINDKGYKVLNPKVGMIWGDGIDPVGITNILSTLDAEGFSSDNIVFGMGGALLQKDINRDTCAFAIKVSYSEHSNGECRNLAKTASTDPNKKSQAGHLKVVKVGDEFKTVNISEEGEDLLIPVFEDGKLLVDYKFSDLRI